MISLGTKIFFCGVYSFIIAALCGQLTGCEKLDTDLSRKEPMGQERLEWSGKVFSMLAYRSEKSGYGNLSVVDHVAGDVTIFEQTEDHSIHMKKRYELGFHPGNMILWQGDSQAIIFAAEGEGAVKAITLDDEYKVISSLEELSPRYVNQFEWPSWGKCLVISPYRDGYVTILKNYDPMTGSYDERVVVALSESQNTLRSAENITVGDIDGDGIVELLVVTKVTGDVLQIKYPGKNKKIKVKSTTLLHIDRYHMPDQVSLIDLDGDSDNDMIVADGAAPSKINLFENDGRGKFKESKPLEFPGVEGIMKTATAFDKDGSLLIMAVSAEKIALYAKPENWKWGDQMDAKSITVKRNITRDLLLEDIDGDGWVDGVIGNYFGKKNVWIAFGPLRDRFSEFERVGFTIN